MQPSKPLTAPPVVLLTLEYAGRTWRHSSQPVSVTDGTRSLLYRGGLDPMDVYTEAPITGVAPAQSQPVDIYPTTDLEQLVAEGHDLAEMTAEIALIAVTDGEEPDIADRRIVLAGRADVMGGGQLGRPLKLQVTADDPATSRGTWPNSEAKLGDDTWGIVGIARRSAEDGAGYPSLVGEAGTIRDAGGWSSVGACPVLPIMLSTSANRFLAFSPWGDIRAAGGGWWTYPATTALLPYGIISEGWVYPGPVGAGQRGIVKGLHRQTGASVWTQVDCELVYAVDLLGRKVTLVDGLVFSSLGVLLDDYEYAVSISPPCAGGATRTFGEGLRGAGEVAHWALLETASTVDWRRTLPALNTMDRFRVAGFWDQQTDIWSWVVQNVLPMLPCSWVAGPRGMHPVIFRLDATADTADLPHLVDGVNCTIESAIEIDADGLLSRASIEYARAIVDGIWRRDLTIHGGELAETVRSVPMLHARKAQQRWGKRRGDQVIALAEALESDIIYRDETAYRWVSWLLWLNSEPRRTFRVVGGYRSPVARAEPGMSAPISSTRHTSLTRRVVHVVRAGWLGGMCYADFEILPLP